MTALDLSTLRAIAEGATPGPWGRATTDGQGWAVHRGAHDTIALYCDRDNAAHIAAFNPEVALAIIQRCQNAEAERDALATKVEAAGSLVSGDCRITQIEGGCLQLVGATFPGGSVWTADMCCQSCRIRAVLAVTP